MAAEALSVRVPFSAQPHRLACYRWGAQNTEAVLCVHGLSRNANDFDFLARALENRYQVLCPDIPGRGGSDWLSPILYNYQTYLFDLQYLLMTLGITRVHWIGTSMGGILGMMASGALPGLIQSLVLNDVGCVIDQDGLKRILSYAGVKMRFDTPAEAEATMRAICEPFGIRDEAHWQHLFKHSLRQASDGKTEFTYDPAITAGFPMPHMVQDINLWALWEPVKRIPTLLIRGAESDILSRDTAEMMRLSHPELSLHEVAQTGHAPMLMDDAQIAVIENWLMQFE